MDDGKSVRTIIITDVNEPYEKLMPAAKCLAQGGLAAFPTETVYGLGANAFDTNAVKKIFEAKGRPNDNPLIVHIANIASLAALTAEVPDYAMELINTFWPGPLTLIFKKSPKIGMDVTAGLHTVAVRMPDHPLALELIRQADTPIAAPSANLSGSPSPTKAGHVIHDLNGRVDYIIDGGCCIVGLESTVLDVTQYPPVILRPGAITPEQVRTIAKAVKLHSTLAIDSPPQFSKTDTIPRSPGMKYRHYSPKAKFILLEGDIDKVIPEIHRLAEKSVNSDLKTGIMCTDEISRKFDPKKYIVKTLGSQNGANEIASRLFAVLRDFDAENCDIIYSQTFSSDDIGFATMNRLYKAAGENLIKVF